MSLPLKNVRLFSNLNEEQCSKLAALMVPRSFEAGETLLQETQNEIGFFLLSDGEARMMVRGEYQQPRLIEKLRPGDFFGELSLVTDEPTPFWVEASARVEALYLSPEDFKGFLQEHPEAVFDIFNVLGRRLIRLEHAFRGRASRDVNELNLEQLTVGQKVADRFAGVIGSWPFIIIQTIVLFIWIVLNLIGWVKAWDPYPFILLNLALSFQAAYAGPIIMMSQNRQSDKDRLAASVDHAVNLKSEVEVGLLLRKIEAVERVVRKSPAHRGPSQPPETP